MTTALWSRMRHKCARNSTTSWRVWSATCRLSSCLKSIRSNYQPTLKVTTCKADFITSHQSHHSHITNRFRAKFKSFVEQYELREIQFQSVLRMKELEVQHQIARYENQRRAQEQDANKNKQLTSQVTTFSQTETELRSQLNIYVEKFKQVSDSDIRDDDSWVQEREGAAASNRAYTDTTTSYGSLDFSATSYGSPGSSIRPARRTGRTASSVGPIPATIKARATSMTKSPGSTPTKSSGSRATDTPSSHSKESPGKLVTSIFHPQRRAKAKAKVILLATP
jgi:hypothetical protein